MGTGQQKADRSEANDLGYGERAYKQGGELARLHPQGQMPGGQPYLLR